MSRKEHLRQTLHERLAATGVLRAQQAKILGYLPAHWWPAQDTSHEEQVRQQPAGALTGQAAPESHAAALIALPHALNCEHKVIDPRQYGLSRRQWQAHAEEIAIDSWAFSGRASGDRGGEPHRSTRVSHVIDEAIIAVMAATGRVGHHGGDHPA